MNTAWGKRLIGFGAGTLLSSLLALPMVTQAARGGVSGGAATPAANASELSAAYSLRVVPHGESSPSGDNRTAAGRQQNRRLDITLAAPVAAETSTPVLASAHPRQQQALFWLSRDPLDLRRRLTLKLPQTATVREGSFVNPVSLVLAADCHAFIERWELQIELRRPDQLHSSVQELAGELDAGRVELTVDRFTPMVAANARELPKLQHGDELHFRLRVYDERNNFDELKPQVLRVVEKHELDADISALTGASDTLALPGDKKPLAAASGNATAFARQAIPVRGARVRVHAHLPQGADALQIDGTRVDVPEQGGVVADYLLPGGNHQFQLDYRTASGRRATHALTTSIDDNYFFMVGLADLTVGQNKVRGNIEALPADTDRYGGDIFVDGRLAFYLKGKVRGKYLVTAQMDTGTEDVGELFDDFHRRDPQSVFRRLDPDKYYLVYGDDSTIRDDTDSQGKVYIRVDWDQSHVLWGNYNTAFSGTELAPFNRSLYGAQLLHRSVASTVHGDTRTDVSAFVSEARSAFRHNEFLGTGGSLYYLRDQDIVRGSEKVWVEIRQPGGEQVLERIPLVAGRDYDIDEFQGRLILSRPLLGISSIAAPSIIRDTPNGIENTWLVVDYEYLPTQTTIGDTTAGARGRHWLSDHLALGGTWAHEDRGDSDYDIRGVDLTYKLAAESYVTAEWARSESRQTAGSFRSSDGGLSFDAFNSNTAEVAAGSGEALSVEARLRVNDVLSMPAETRLRGWYKRRDAGFSTANIDTGADTTDSGLELQSELGTDTSLLLRLTDLDRDGAGRSRTGSLQLQHRWSKRFDTTIELQHQQESDAGSANTAAGTLLATRLAYRLDESITLYGTGQTTLDQRGGYADNDSITLGADVAVHEGLSFHAEVSDGDRGRGALLGGEYQMTPDHGFYSNLSTTTADSGRVDNAITLGQRKQLSDRLKVYTEHQFSRQQGSGNNSDVIAHTVGGEQTLNRHATAGLSIQRSTLADSDGGTTTRDAVSATADYRNGRSKAGTRVEYRRDRSDASDRRQWLLTQHAEYRQSEALRWQARVNGSITEDQQRDEREAEFAEIGVGFALRPISHDRVNLLGRLTWLHDVAPASQRNNNAGDTDPAEVAEGGAGVVVSDAAADRRALIGSLEGVYELNRRWNLGSKVAHRHGEQRLPGADAAWLGNDATLFALRFQHRTPFGLEGMLSWHWLHSSATDTLSNGALVSVGHPVGDNLRLSVGYNFTGFDDDLASEDYDLRGWFLNLVGSY